MTDFKTDPRFAGIEAFQNKVWLSSPTMHGDEQHWVDNAIETNWVSTVGANINEVEKQIADYVGCQYAVALSAGTAALHLATKLAGERLYGQARPNEGTLRGHRVFCSDTTFDASINPVAYEDGEAVFIDTEYDTWNMCPEALEKAFAFYPDTKLIVVAHLYGTPGKIEEIRRIADRHGALIVEDAAESLGARYLLDGKWVETGTLGDFNCISFNGNKIITEEIGYNYRMSNIIAGIVRGQMPYLAEHIDQKRAIWERYEKGLADLPVRMNPWDREKSVPNFWLSCLIIDEDAMAPHVRGEQDELWTHVPGKSSPGEILAAIAAFNAEGRPVWKPMHMQPIYRTHAFITAEGNGRGRSNAYIAGSGIDVGADIFRRGLCLPSDNKMTPAQQDRIIEIIHRCFR